MLRNSGRWGMALPQRQQALARTLLEENAQILAQVHRLTDNLDETQLNWQPPDGGWGVGLILEHLCLGAESYMNPAQKAAASPTAPRGGPDAKWQPSLGGQFLLTALRSPLKLPAPPALKPLKSPRPGVRAEFLRFHGELSRLLVSTIELEWKKIDIPSPASRLLKMNMGDAFVILIKHAQRHLAQMERVAARQGFPAAAEALQG
jgi:hypothetical protein